MSNSLPIKVSQSRTSKMRAQRTSSLLYRLAHWKCLVTWRIINSTIQATSRVCKKSQGSSVLLSLST